MKEIKISGLVYNDTFGSVSLCKESYNCLNLKERLCLIKTIVRELDSISNNGYLNTLDLRQYPVINTFLNAFILTGTNEFDNGEKSMESYK